MAGYPVRPIQPRLEARIQPEPNSGCWLWTGPIGTRGYGQLDVACKTHAAHRLSWLVYRGEIPAEMHVLHKCDNRLCINPDHLFLGDQNTNMKDMKSKGRARNQHTIDGHTSV